MLCTCGTLLQLLIFLFPPLPGLEDAPQAGQLAIPADGWSVDPRHQATRPQHPLLVHKLYCSYCQRKKWGWGWYSMSEVQHHTDTDTHMIPYFLLYIPQHCDGKSLHMLVKKVMYIMSAQSSNSHSSHIHSAVFCQIN